MRTFIIRVVVVALVARQQLCKDIEPVLEFDVIGYFYVGWYGNCRRRPTFSRVLFFMISSLTNSFQANFTQTSGFVMRQEVISMARRSRLFVFGSA